MLELILLAVVGLSQAIPKTWDEEALVSWTIPPADRTVHTLHVFADFYYSIPVLPIYKSYPIYHPSKAPPGYLDRLRRAEPELISDFSGKLVFEAPLSYGSAEDASDPDWYTKPGIVLTKDGIVPGVRYVVRKKGVVEIGWGRALHATAASACCPMEPSSTARKPISPWSGNSPGRFARGALRTGRGACRTAFFADNDPGNHERAVREDAG